MRIPLFFWWGNDLAGHSIAAAEDGERAKFGGAASWRAWRGSMKRASLANCK